jgi:hypothetical protein
MNELTTYQKLAEEACDQYYSSSFRKAPSEADRSHVINIARSIMMHRDGILTGGGFVTAVIENNLEATVTRADSVCAQNIPFFVYCKLHIHNQNS